MPSVHLSAAPSTASLSRSPSSKPISISLSSRSNAPTSSVKSNPQNPKKRPHSSLADNSDSDHERSIHEPQLVSTFDHSVGGAIGINGVEKPKAPLIVPAQKNRDWREESRRKRGKNILPAEVQAARAEHVPNGKNIADEATRAFGLTFVTKDEKNGDERMGNTEENGAILALAQVESKVKSVDEEAIEALIGDRKKKSDLVVSIAKGANDADGIFTGRSKDISEEDAYRQDIAIRPGSPSLDYAAIPVDEFGDALLRGMGWREDASLTSAKKAPAVEKRFPLLGVGAKEVPRGLGELEARGKGTKRKREIDKMYNPVLLRNSRTGEVLTEEELKGKLEARKREDDEGRERMERNLAADEIKKTGRRRSDERERESRRVDDGERESRRGKDRDRERERDRRRGDERRERSRSPRRRDRRREYEEEGLYERRDREREGERERRHRRKDEHDRRHERR